MNRVLFCWVALAAVSGCTNHVADLAASDTMLLRTESFEVPAGQERFLCYAKTLEEDVAIDRYRSNAEPYVHHLVFARALAPEPEGFAECDTLFRMTWDPLYIAGAGGSELSFPGKAGHELKKGTQLVLQMHLLNSRDVSVTGEVEIEMHRMSASHPRPVNTYIFGTTDLQLAPHQPSQAVGDCQLPERVQLVAGFPHMHALGRSLRFETGPTLESLSTVFVRDPYQFDDQHSEALALDLTPGSFARVTCGYDNTELRTVTFGESTHDEMCFLIGFAIDQAEIKSCVQRPASP